MARLHQQMLDEAKCRLPLRMPTHLEAKALVPTASVWTGYCQLSSADAACDVRLDISATNAPADNWRWHGGDGMRLVVAIWYGELTCSGRGMPVWVTEYITIDGCVLVKIDDLQVCVDSVSNAPQWIACVLRGCLVALNSSAAMGLLQYIAALQGAAGNGYPSVSCCTNSFWLLSLQSEEGPPPPPNSPPLSLRKICKRF